MTRLQLPLVTGSPLWGPVDGPLLPPLEGEHRCEVAIVGAGLVGLTLALALAKRGLPALVVEAARVSAGSTSASTALLLWETDIDLRELSRRMGAERAASIWRSCLETLDWLDELTSDGRLASFARVESVYYASDPADTAGLRRAPEVARWSGLFPNSPDSLPYVGRVPELDGGDAVLGFGGNGMVFGLLGARLLARSLAGDDVEQELTTYAYDRLSPLVRARLRVEEALQSVRLR